MNREGRQEREVKTGFLEICRFPIFNPSRPWRSSR
jgi:hypothetical protein